MQSTHHPTTPVAFSKTAALARVLDLVPRGYLYFTLGACPVERVERLAQKFHDLYGIGDSPAQRVTRRGKGLANAALVLYCPPAGGRGGSPLVGVAVTGDETGAGKEASTGQSSGVSTALACAGSPALTLAALPPGTPVSWLLLATAGEGPVHAREKPACVTQKPRLVFLGYELVRHPARGRTAWTFRRTAAEMAEWYALLAAQLNRHQEGAAEETLRCLSRQPGFAGVRAQSWDLCQFARQRGYARALPELFFVQKVSHGARLSLLSSAGAC